MMDDENLGGGSGQAKVNMGSDRRGGGRGQVKVSRKHGRWWSTSVVEVVVKVSSSGGQAKVSRKGGSGVRPRSAESVGGGQAQVSSSSRWWSSEGRRRRRSLRASSGR